MKRFGPEIKMPKLKRPALGSKSFKAPPFIADVIHDLRERRLLPLVALVVVAILAVPFLLGNSEETVPPPTTGGAGGVADLEVTGEPTLTVVQAKPGLRDYKKRLRGRTPNDPFKQKYTSLPPEAKLQSTVETSPTSGGGSSEVSVTDEGDTVTVEVDDDGTTGSTPGGGSGSPPADAPGGRPVPDGGQFYAYRPDVRFGIAGGPARLTVYRDLPIASLLPKENPVLFFIGATEAGDRVVFDVSAEVVMVKEGGKCIGGRQSCGLLFMREGEAVTVLTESAGRTFRLAVDSIDFVPVDRPKPAGASAAGEPQVPRFSQNFSK